MRSMEMALENEVKRHFLYNDHPMRENPDRIDHYLRLGLVEKRKQLLRLKTAERIVKLC